LRRTHTCDSYSTILLHRRLSMILGALSHPPATPAKPPSISVNHILELCLALVDLTTCCIIKASPSIAYMYLGLEAPVRHFLGQGWVPGEERGGAEIAVFA
jgi:hypothetical protein